jgi:sterol desaturase/sphingolipid hydroxylase (fatty acid hydroxylase superfamily)
MFIHSHLSLDLRAIEPVVVTPRLHRVHHDPATTHKNFGTFLPLWDRLLRDTFVHREVAPDVAFGVPGEVDAYPQGWWSQLVWPFRSVADGLAAIATDPSSR